MLEARDTVGRPTRPLTGTATRGLTFREELLATLPIALLLLATACALVADATGGASPPPSGSLSVSFIDVGQGDGVLVQAGGEDYLLDAGRAEEGPEVVDFLRSRGVEGLEGIVVSNPDADHIGGFLDVFDAFEVETVYASGDPKGTLTYKTFLRVARDEGSRFEVVRAGRRMEWAAVQADAWIPKHPAFRAAFPCPDDRTRAPKWSWRQTSDWAMAAHAATVCKLSSRRPQLGQGPLEEPRVVQNQVVRVHQQVGREPAVEAQETVDSAAVAPLEAGVALRLRPGLQLPPSK